MVAGGGVEMESFDRGFLIEKRPFKFAFGLRYLVK